MAAALREGILGGAGLDTFEEEPLRTDHPLLDAPNIVFSGHEASSTPEAFDRLYVAAVEALIEIAAGRPPAGLVGEPSMDLSPLGQSPASGRRHCPGLGDGRSAAT
jgi:D-3-phosphoglycerate dehydrogenase